MISSGILIVDKPSQATSHDIVDFIRKKFKIRKVGHAGTLDPVATGLLVMLLGSSTRRANGFINDDKEYDCLLRLGIRTDTQDLEGKIVSEEDPSNILQKDIEKIFNSFLGPQEQTPPMYSAVKHKGRKLYELAREGKVIERKPRYIKIYELKISHIKLPDVKFRVHCSKGTYIRQLCSDIGDSLGCGGYMHSLRRERSGRFSIEDALDINELKGMNEKDLLKHIIQ